MKSQTERKSDPKALKLKYLSLTQTPNLKNPVKLSSPSSMDEVRGRAAWGSRATPGSRGQGLVRIPWGGARPRGSCAAPRSRGLGLAPRPWVVHLVVAVVAAWASGGCGGVFVSWIEA